MKYGKFVGEKCLPLTVEEIKQFKAMFGSLCKKWSCVELCKVKVLKGNSNSIAFVIPFKETARIRNHYGNRITAYSIHLLVSKNSGYLDNYDWINGKLIDSSKERKDYTFAPPYQYSGNLLVDGTEVKFRCRNSSNINGGIYFYGTELSDFKAEINVALHNIFRNILR